MAFVYRVLSSSSIVLGLGLGASLGAVGCMAQQQTNAGAITASGSGDAHPVVEISLRDDAHPERDWPVAEGTAHQVYETGQLLACGGSDALNSLATGAVISCHPVDENSGSLGDDAVLVGINQRDAKISFSLLSPDNSSPTLMLAASQEEIKDCVRNEGGVACFEPDYEPNNTKYKAPGALAAVFSRDDNKNPSWDV